MYWIMTDGENSLIACIWCLMIDWFVIWPVLDSRTYGSRTMTWGSNTRTCKLVLEDKDFPRGQQHWVTVKNGLLADICLQNAKSFWELCGPRTRTCKLVLEDPQGQELSSRTTALDMTDKMLFIMLVYLQFWYWTTATANKVPCSRKLHVIPAERPHGCQGVYTGIIYIYCARLCIYFVWKKCARLRCLCTER